MMKVCYFEGEKSTCSCVVLNHVGKEAEKWLWNYKKFDPKKKKKKERKSVEERIFCIYVLSFEMKGEKRKRQQISTQNHAKSTEVEVGVFWLDFFKI